MSCQEPCKEMQHTIIMWLILLTCPIALLFLWPWPKKEVKKG